MKTLLAVLGAAALLTAANPAFAASCNKGKAHARVATYKAAPVAAVPTPAAKTEGPSVAPVAATEQTGAVTQQARGEGQPSA